MALPAVVILGDLLLDVLVELDAPPVPGTDTRAHIRTQAGGSGANQAAWLAHLGVETHFVGRTGRDPAGRLLAADLASSGVVPHLAEDPDEPTGTVAVLIDRHGERTMLTDRGAGRHLGPEDVPQELFRPGRHLHLSGYSFFAGRPRAAALQALRRARAAGMSWSVDPASAAFLAEVGRDRFLEWTRGADLCFPNRAEGALLAGTDEPARIAAALTAHYRGVVLKLGAEGAMYAGLPAEGRRLPAEGRSGAGSPGRPEAPVKPLPPLHVPAEPARVVDTTGAGDALCAGFLAAWLGGAPPDDALRQAVKVAARAVERLGGRP